MKAFKTSLLIFLCLAGESLLAAGPLKTIKVKLGDSLAIARGTNELEAMRAAYDADKFKECLALGAKLGAKAAPVQPWVHLLRLRCASAEVLKTGTSPKDLAALLQEARKNPDWLLVGGSARPLRLEIVTGGLLWLERQRRGERAAAWEAATFLLEIRDWLDASQRAKLYAVGAELHLADKNSAASRTFLERSLKEEKNSEVQGRLEALLRSSEDAKPLEPVTTKQVGSSEDELEIFDKMKAASRQGDALEAVESGVKLLRDYPGSSKASEAARDVLNAYLSVSAKTEEGTKAREKMQTEMKRVDGQRLFEWAQALVLRERYPEAVELAKGSLEMVGGQPMSTQVLLLAAQSAHHSANFELARELYERLIRQHAGTRAAGEAVYRLGLVDFRAERYAQAAERFESFLLLETSSDYELSSLYWLWRAYQKLESPKAATTSARLMRLYPVSYYGLRARAEANGGILKLEKTLKVTPEWSLVLTPMQAAAWERFLILKKAGWVAESLAELATLDEPARADEKVVYAYVLSQAGDYFRAAEVLNRGFMMDTSLVSHATLLVGYPEAFQKEIQTEAARYGLPAELVQGLIKQESSFRVDVKSPAGAMGLMQLMPVTAREVASDMRIKLPDLARDLARPSVNIRIGTQYLNRRLKAFEGNVPLALAAYNAGIGNIRSWRAGRADLAELEKNPSSAPLQELWFDELPWAETTGYIKSILRNYLVYKLLDLGEVELQDPVWKF